GDLLFDGFDDIHEGHLGYTGICRPPGRQFARHCTRNPTTALRHIFTARADLTMLLRRGARAFARPRGFPITSRPSFFRRPGDFPAGPFSDVGAFSPQGPAILQGNDNERTALSLADGLHPRGAQRPPATSHRAEGPARPGHPLRAAEES